MTPPPFVTAVLLAAGRSTRMAESARKPFLEIAGRTVVEHALEAFDRARLVSEIVLVGRRDDLDELERLGAGCGKVAARVIGGSQRTDSVHRGVAAASKEANVILVHDVARPLVRPESIDEVAEAAAEHGAALLAVPVSDTIKSSTDGEEVAATLDRSMLWAAQTPQGFRAERFREILAAARTDGYRPTDDAAIWERYEGPVRIVAGDRENLKLTTPSDLAIAEALLRLREGGA